MIQLHNVNAYYGRVQALRSVSMNLTAGKIFSVLGANGAGKTTLLRSILGLAQTTGSIHFEGEDISALPTYERVRRGIAVVPEGRRLFSEFTVGENLRIGAINRTDRAEVDADIDEMCTFFPILRKRFEQPSGTLSGGEGQMLALSRALLSRPKLLLLDEPSVGLMPIAVSDIFNMVGKICRDKGLTVLLVEQNAKKALQIADNAAVLELGAVAFEGDVETLKADGRLKEAYLGH
ncbi:MAG: ABC transporter ATP-binding protein [Rhizobiales bacterium 62-47]|nr:ABC transporter ATP-binding protein [Hyphomicrobiales bacterium]OJY10924.1 MAG: ABC transporter ATP-binding protein [Rhizobiales bacterium 62-47]